MIKYKICFMSWDYPQRDDKIREIRRYQIRTKDIVYITSDKILQIVLYFIVYSD